MQASPSQGMLARINPDTTGQAGFSSQQELTIMLTRKADAAPKVVDFPPFVVKHTMRGTLKI